jgi:hypothetical protein
MGGALTSLLNGNADVFSTGVAETAEQVKAGKIKVFGDNIRGKAERGHYFRNFQQRRSKELMQLSLIGEDFLDRLIWTKLL